jgi:hypothetical protein
VSKPILQNQNKKKGVSEFHTGGESPFEKTKHKTKQSIRRRAQLT